MIKKFSKIIFILSLLILLSACNISEGDVKDRINAPENMKPPIEGKWKITDRLNDEDDSIDLTNDKNIDMEGLFRKEALILGKDFTEKPSFRIKNVKANDYFMYKYKKNYYDLGFEENTIQVITVLDSDKYFFDIIKLNKDTAIIYKDNNFYKLERVSKEVSLEEVSRYIEVERNMVQTVDNVTGEDLESGVLLGIKIPKYDNYNSIPKWEYKTLWLNTSNGEVKSSYIIDDLLLPRKNGFWKIAVDRVIDSGSVVDKIKTEGQIVNLDEYNKEPNRMLNINNKRGIKDEGYELKNILFLSNDYMSIEKIENKENEKRTLEILGIDNIDDEKGLKLSDILGEEGKDIFKEGVEANIDVNNKAKVSESNIGVGRKDGYWILKGRVNYVEKEKQLYKDFNIKAIPPEELVKYDKLSISWSELDSKIANLVDVFSSPNEELIIAQTERELLVLKVKDGEIVDENELYSIELPRNVSVVMAEWATGKYTNLWEEEVKKNDKSSLE